MTNRVGDRATTLQHLSRDLVEPKWMYLKAVLFLIILLSCGGVLLLDSPRWRTVVLLTPVVWSSARLYYFMFYVIERYIDPNFRFSGIGAALSYILGRIRTMTYSEVPSGRAFARLERPAILPPFETPSVGCVQTTSIGAQFGNPCIAETRRGQGDAKAAGSQVRAFPTAQDLVAHFIQ